MEEQSKTGKKGSTKKKLDDAKVMEAKKKINDLLQGTGLEDPIEQDVYTPPIEATNEFIPSTDAATDWLNQQVAALSKQVEQYEKTIVALKSENTALQNSMSGAPLQNVQDLSASDRNKIIEIYKHFEGVYTGRKFGSPFGTAQLSYPQSGSGVLDVFIATFPFLQDVKQYKHWG